MFTKTIQPINTIHGNLELKDENIDSLDLIESKRCTEQVCRQSEYRIGCRYCRHSYIKNFKYYFKHKLEDLKLQAFDYEQHFKKSCFNCSSSFHGSSYKDGHFNLQKIPEMVKKCDACQKNYTTERLFYHNCNICNRSFENCQLLYHHRIRKHDSKEPHQCAVCYKSLFDRDLAQHLLKHNLPYICPYCNKRFETKLYLKQHILRVCTPSFENEFKCKLCPKEFNDKYRFKKHQNFHAKLYACEYCNKNFSSRNLLKRHSYIHTQDWPYNCSICNKGFPFENMFSSHMLSHTGEKPFSCEFCVKKYKTKRSFDIHVFEQHNGDKELPKETRFQCDYCPKQFIVKRDLEIHIFQHTDGKQFKCDLCDKKFTTHHILKRHKYVHMENSFQCTYCPKNYKRKNCLDLHLFEHTGGEKPFKCDFCDKAFAKQHLLNQHKIIHNKKSFQCKYCPKQFRKKHHFDIHLFKHTGGVEFKCDFCGKIFAMQHLLNRHKLSHTEKSIQCSSCPKFYKSTKDLSAHLKRVHKLLG